MSSQNTSAGVPVIEMLCGTFARAAVRLPSLVAMTSLMIFGSAVLASQDAEVNVHVRIVDEVVFVDVDCFVRATPEEAWLVLTDYDNATRFISKLERSVSTTTASGLVLVSQKGTMGFGPFSVPLETVMEMRLTPVEKIQARLISGTMKKYEAVTTLLRDPLGTRLTHRSEAIPDIWIPPVIGQAMVSYEAKERFGQLLAEILRRKGRPDATR